MAPTTLTNSDLPTLRNSILLAVLTEAAARSGVAATWASVGAVVLHEALGRVRKLKPDEVVALYVFKSLAVGGSMYDLWAIESELVARLTQEHIEDVQLSEDRARDLLARMKVDGILEGSLGRLRAAR